MRKTQQCTMISYGNLCMIINKMHAKMYITIKKESKIYFNYFNTIQKQEHEEY